MDLNKEQLEDLVIYVGSKPTKWRKRDSEMQVCCPVHGESNPSMGVSVDKQVCHCFSCGFTGDWASLLYHALPDEFGYNDSTEEEAKKTRGRAYYSAMKFLAERYELEFREIGSNTKSIKRYEDFNQYLEERVESETPSLPMYKIAPYMSGKETYKYFFNRGFTKADMKKYMIGRDLENETVTIPVFNEDGTLAGVIGRYISAKRKKNERYKIYDEFNRGKVLYPLNYYEPKDETIIGVEGQFDAIAMHEKGFTNTLAHMSNFMTEVQADWIADNCETYIHIGDNDSRGIEAREHNRKLLGNRVRFKYVDYPEEGKDPCDWTTEQIQYMIDNAHGVLTRKIKRIE